MPSSLSDTLLKSGKYITGTSAPLINRNTFNAGLEPLPTPFPPEENRSRTILLYVLSVVGFIFFCACARIIVSMCCRRNDSPMDSVEGNSGSRNRSTASTSLTRAAGSNISSQRPASHSRTRWTRDSFETDSFDVFSSPGKSESFIPSYRKL